MSEYKPPIDVTFRDTIESIEKEWVNGVDNYIVSTVREVTGVDVDKKRLINALMIDKKLVRCMDCRYMFIEGKTTKFYYCNKFASSVDETGYCAWGEKNECNR